MTAPELLAYLHYLGVTLHVTPDGALGWRVPRGIMTTSVLAAMRAQKAALIALLLPTPAGPAPDPAADEPRYTFASRRTWVTGGVVSMGQTMAILPAPIHQDTPSAPMTRKGSPCPKKGCGVTQYYQPSGLCVACHTRLVQRWKQAGAPQV